MGNGTFAVGCSDGTKQHAVRKIVEHLAATEGVHIQASMVWHFDDRRNNIEPFTGTGYNAREVSCALRDYCGAVGLCGAEKHEIVPEVGIVLCPEPETPPCPEPETPPPLPTENASQSQGDQF